MTSKKTKEELAEASEMEVVKEYAQFRRDLRQVLADNGIRSNSGWTEKDIVEAFRSKLAKA